MSFSKGIFAQKPTPMLPGLTYHVFNRANGNEKLFSEERNYHFFLDKIGFYILPIAKLDGYCLMPNHFHLLIEIKPPEELQLLFPKENDPTGLEKKISKSFANLFSAYTQAYNKLYNRMGNLFMSSFKRKRIESTTDYCTVLHYIHANPVHHGYVQKMDDWKFSSYKALTGIGKTLLDRDKVHNIFGDRNDFLAYHQRPIDLKLKFLDS